MNKLTYTTKHIVTVKLDGKTVGTIEREGHEDQPRYRYYPKGDKVGGDSFATLEACKNSLES